MRLVPMTTGVRARGSCDRGAGQARWRSRGSEMVARELPYGGGGVLG